MPKGSDIINLARTRIGSQYVFGVLAPKDDRNYPGPWDCAEFVSWVLYQLTGKLYGCTNNNGNPHTADAYSGHFARDIKNGTLIPISLDEAKRTVGAILVRVAEGELVGHVAFSEGNGKTVEANSTKYGTIESHIDGRRWDLAAKVPGIEHEGEGDAEIVTPPAHTIYRLTTPMMHDEFIKEIQKRIGVNVDGWYGKQTFTAVKAFQIGHGLTPDGEVGQQTLIALGLK
jgi:N-acetylmuramoyl-L-alanine amidase